MMCLDRESTLIYLRNMLSLESAKQELGKRIDETEKQLRIRSEDFEDEEAQAVHAEYKRLDGLYRESPSSPGAQVIFLLLEIVAFVGSFVDLFIDSDIAIFLVGSMIVIALLMIPTVRSLRKHVKIMIDYRDIKKAYAESKKRSDLENEKWMADERAKKFDIQDELIKVDRLIDEGYGVNILPSPYRRFPAMYYIYDYMATSNATLEDAFLHAHLEEGIRLISSKLDTVLAEVRKLQRMTAYSITQNMQILHTAELAASNANEA